MSKQTSIEWLDKQIQEHIISQDLIAQNLIIQISISDYFEIIKQAKQMHKEEIYDAYINGWRERFSPKGTATNYYNETYGGNK